ncbi:LysR family transcriptional regulator [Paenibacillus prosopidis]|uniref:DNA-binding transcriptional LysR family regulator n=1 Tax=Paenibacillus prosopidis TaxID=630520 RepID=A0A368VLK9_9BACL|nr:LysR family transcriptional regulator [Paenibacillus prosopidis]RCW39898.1 DNA-binding transcriptional LysR family regulator [Paenibacillus prosopidis]
MVENMEWYRVFYFTAKAGSLSKAAEELYITQPAVTHSIKQLEARLGGQLFFRTSKGVKLTNEGELLFKYIEQAYNFISTGERKIAEMHQLMDGEIKIGAGDTLCKHYLLPYLETFHQTYPAIKFQVTNRTTPETINLLKQGKIDFGIVNLPIQDPKITIQESVSIEDCFIAGEKFKHLSEEPVSLETLVGYPILLLEKGSSIRAYIDWFTGRSGVTIKPEIELGSIDLLMEFTRTGFGIACVIKNFITKELAQSSVYEIKLTNSIPPRKIGIIKLKDVPLSTAASRFIELLPGNS